MRENEGMEDRPFKSAKRLFRPVLLARGFCLTREQYDLPVFGSEYGVFERGELCLRLIWDGKDQWLAVEAIDRSRTYMIDYNRDAQELLEATCQWLDQHDA